MAIEYKDHDFSSSYICEALRYGAAGDQRSPEGPGKC